MNFLRIISISLIVSLILCLHPVSPAAWNQLPLLTESPTVLPAGHVRFDLGLQYLSNKNFPFSSFSEDSSRDVLSLPTLAMSIGLGKRSELQITYEMLFVEEEEFLIREQWKSGDIAFFTKIELLEEQENLPGMGVKVGAKLPNSGDQYRVGTDETDLTFSTLFEKHLSSVKFFANAGLLILGNPYENAEQDDLLSYGIACSIPWNDHVTYTAEIAGQHFGRANNERSLALLHVHIHDGNLIWNVSGRVGLIENSEDWGLSGGVSLTFDVLKHWASSKERR
jgi:hypothetical protein